MKSSTDGEDAAVPGGSGTLIRVATGLRLRGGGGRLTARLIPGGINQLRERGTVYVGGGAGPWTPFQVEEYDVYGRRVALKLRGIDSAALAERYVGLDISLPCNGLVDLPEGSYYIFELVGLRVQTRDGRVLGTVRRVVETGGTPLLAVEPSAEPGRTGEREPILLPAARSICVLIDTDAGSITVEPPEGLLELYGI